MSELAKMTDTLHTEAPWQISKGISRDFNWIVVNPIGDAELGNWLVAKVMWEPDADLIAAAPELLAFLQETREQLHCDYTKLDALIAKATGEKSATARDCPT